MTDTAPVTASGRRLPVSIVVAVYQGERYLARALASIRAQTARPAEVIIVNDGSTDASAEIAKQAAASFAAAEIATTYLEQSNAGQSAARNAGLARVKEPWVCFFDQDDLMRPHHLASLFAAVSASGKAGASARFAQIDATDRIVVADGLAALNYAPPEPTLAAFLARNLMMLPSATLLDTEAVRAAGGFDARLSGYEDDDLFTRMLAAGVRFAQLSEVGIDYRIHGNNSSATPRYRASRLLFFRLWLARLRERDEHAAIGGLSERIFRDVLNDLVTAERAADRATVATARATLAEISKTGRLGIRSRLIALAARRALVIRALLRGRGLIEPGR